MKISSVLMLIFLVGTLTACNVPMGTGGGAAATAAATESSVGMLGTDILPTSESQRSEVPSLSPAALNGLSSYRMRIYLNWDREDKGSVTYHAEEGIWDQVVDNQKTLRKMSAFLSPGIELEWIQQQNKGWECYENFVRCTALDRSLEDAVSIMGQGTLLGVEPILSNAGVGVFEYIGDARIGDIAVRHYTIDYLLLVESVHLGEQGSVSEHSGEVWIAYELGLPQFVVKLQLTWRGLYGDSMGSGKFMYEVYDVNLPVDIALPE